MMKKKSVSPFVQKASAKDWADWRWQLKNRLTCPILPGTLSQTAASFPETIQAVTDVYPMAVTPYYLSLIKQQDFHDPIYAQCMPDPRETSAAGRAAEDPLQEDLHMPVPKLVHRYPDRCLAIVTETCAVYCRHCNRKRFWSRPASLNLTDRLQKITRYIAESPRIREVIISGGDPLTLDDRVLEKILASLKAIPHVDVLRIGSRGPVVLPMRITRTLCRMLKRYRPLWFNTQFNHPAEITPESARACNMLQEAGIPVSSQSVLLKGVNDSPDIMGDLLYGLQKMSVRPYYLFHCDPAQGCLHFRTEVPAGLDMMEKIWRHCSGLCVPQYVLDVPGKVGKIPLNILSETMKNDLKKHQHFFDKRQEID